MNTEKKGGIIGVIITIIILIILVIFTNANSTNIFAIENFANKIVAPIQNGLTYLKNKINNNDKFFEDINNLKQENKELKEKNSELEQTLREFEIVKNENEQLKQELNLSEKYANYSTIPGTVIERSISNYSKIIVINVGSKQGIKEDMTVIANEGLVGHVISVTDSTAKVQLITDSASSTSCSTSSTRDNMICKGIIESTNTLKASYINTDAKIIQGDSIETSGLGGIYSKGIHVGKIKKVVEGTNKIDSYAIIETAVDFTKLETVLVITK